MKSRPTYAAWFAAALTLFCGAAIAGDSLLVPYVPNGATDAQVIAIAKQAFMNRQWSIENSDEKSVTAMLSHRGYECRVTVFLSGNVLAYEDDCVQTVNSPGPNTFAMTKKKTSAPDNWIVNLRKDISISLAAIPNVTQSSAETGSSTSVEERFKTLQGLLDAGFISQEEFKQKREEILKSL